MDFIQNEVTGIMEGHVDATILRTPKNWLKNSNGTEYGIVDVEFTAGGVTQKGGVIAYKNLLDAVEYAKGDECRIALQLEGEYAGRGRVVLAASKPFDISMFAQAKPVAETA